MRDRKDRIEHLALLPMLIAQGGQEALSKDKIGSTISC